MAIRLSSLFLVVIFTFSSCGDCRFVDCPIAVFFDIRIADKVTSNSMLIESDSLYHVDEMSMTSLVDGKQIDGQLYRSSTGTNDSLPIMCWSNVAPDVIFLKLNQDDTDTLRFINQFVESECCSFYELDSVSINGGEMMVVLDGTVTILK